MERIYYKVIDQNCELFKDCSVFLTMEEQLRQAQKEAIEAHVPKFTAYCGERGFNRIIHYKGFVFEEQENIDPKVWTTKMLDGKSYSAPNRRTKAGREIEKFLKEFKRTSCWDVDRLLNIEKQSLNGSFYPVGLFKHNDTIYIFIDSQYRKTFEAENNGFIEITLGEMERAIDDYNNTI